MSPPLNIDLPGDRDSRAAAVETYEGDDFRELAASGGLDIATDLRFRGFQGVNFDGQNLDGCDFTGANLTGATFDDARVSRALFDMAKLDLAAFRKARDFDAYVAEFASRRSSARARPSPRDLPDLARFREAPFAPEMIVAPKGEFLMGSDDSDPEAFDDEKSKAGGKRRMRIPERFALGRYPVTFEEFEVFCAMKKHKSPYDGGWGKDRRPVIHVSWADAKAYVDWLNEILGVSAYGLPSEAQWEYACRASPREFRPTRYPWGDEWDDAKANGNRSFEGGRTSPVGTYAPNDWGFHDMIGNVWEWCADEWTETLDGLPPDALPKVSRKGTSKARVVRGGSWDFSPWLLRAAVRDRDEADDQNEVLGFRLSRTL